MCTCCLREVGPDQLGSLLLIALLCDVTCRQTKTDTLTPRLLASGSAAWQDGVKHSSEWEGKQKAAVEENVTYHIVLSHPSVLNQDQMLPSSLSVSAARAAGSASSRREAELADWLHSA